MGVPRRFVVDVGIAAVAADVNGVAILFAGGLYDLVDIVVPERVKRLVGGIIAAGAGIVSVPANIGTGGCLCGVPDKIMPGEIAVRLAADGALGPFGAGGRAAAVGGVAGCGLAARALIPMLRRVEFQQGEVMVKRVKLPVGGVITAGAGVIGVPAGLRTGRRLTVVMHKVVLRGDFGVLGVGGIAALAAGIVFAPAVLGAGGGFRFVLYQRMGQRIDPAANGAAVRLAAGCVAGVRAAQPRELRFLLTYDALINGNVPLQAGEIAHDVACEIKIPILSADVAERANLLRRRGVRRAERAQKRQQRQQKEDRSPFHFYASLFPAF